MSEKMHLAENLNRDRTKTRAKMGGWTVELKAWRQKRSKIPSVMPSVRVRPLQDLPHELTTAIWLQRKDLPRTEDVCIGPIIGRCWTEASFRNTRAFSRIELSHPAMKGIKHNHLMPSPRVRARSRSAT